jgi:hypothetical protein
MTERRYGKYTVQVKGLCRRDGLGTSNDSRGSGWRSSVTEIELAVAALRSDAEKTALLFCQSLLKPFAR